MKEIKIAFAGGGTGGHIYPGLAIADELRTIAKDKGVSLKTYWIGNKSAMDKSIVEKSSSVDEFKGISCGKLRRYFSFRNFLDVFKIFAGCLSSFFYLMKIKPDLLFSKGGFVSVPPCFAAKLLRIPVFTHECDFTPGLATRINSKFATKILVSYEETKKYLSNSSKVIVTGNPVRPAFYECNSEEGKSRGYEFLGLDKNCEKPILLVMGGSLGALQINNLVLENLGYLTEKYIVVHQTGARFQEEHPEIFDKKIENYKPYAFIYEQMPSVISCADVVLSRAGANSLWECAVLKKPLILIPLCGSGTRGDQVDNAKFFENKGVAIVLEKDIADSTHLKSAVDKLFDKTERMHFSESYDTFIPKERCAFSIAKLLFSTIESNSK